MQVKRDLLISKGWIQTIIIVGLLASPSSGYFAYRTHTDEPPIPSQVAEKVG
jgi:hypothetical protein